MKYFRMVEGGGPGLTTWFLEGVGQMTMFDHDGGRGVKIFENLGCPHKQTCLPKDLVTVAAIHKRP